MLLKVIRSTLIALGPPSSPLKALSRSIKRKSTDRGSSIGSTKKASDADAHVDAKADAGVEEARDGFPKFHLNSANGSIYQGPLNGKLFEAVADASGRDRQTVMKIRIQPQDRSVKGAVYCRKDQAAGLHKQLFDKETGFVTTVATKQFAQMVELNHSNEPISNFTVHFVVQAVPLNLEPRPGAS